MKFLLDTDICIYIIRKKNSLLLDRLAKCRVQDLAISSITLSELFDGVEKSQHRQQNMVALIRFLSPLTVLAYDDLAAKSYGIIRAELERQGNLIGGLDMLIAAHACSQKLILVTNNGREFKRVKSLTVENWTAEKESI